MKKVRKSYLLIFIVLGVLNSCADTEDTEKTMQRTWSGSDWSEYLGGPDRNHYSILNQIDASNVDQLEVAWQYSTLDTGQIQSNPLIVDGVLYSMTATTEPFALNAATGQEYWRKDTDSLDQFNTSRGLVYWEQGDDRRILYTHGEWLHAVNAATGEDIPSFGNNGRVSLKAGLGETAENKMVLSNTPGTVYGDLIIMPLRVSEGSDAALGHIQAFNIKSGELEWVFHTIPQPGEFGYETWPKNTYKNTQVGGANNWAGMAVDRQRGIVYAPTGSAAYDFYGSNRTGKNLFANTLLALDAETGERIWHYQFVHHDMLDRDPPAPPNLVTVNHKGKKVDAVAQVTKQGFVFLFDRETGKPLFPIEETPVPSSDIPGENTWPTQPFPTKPKPFARHKITEEDISPYAENKEELLDILRKSRLDGPFTPLSTDGTLVYPGLDGGAEWGGAAVDPDGILYVNSSEMAWNIGLGPSASEEELESFSEGQRIYTLNCVACHGADLKGNSASGFPSLVELSNTREKDYVANIIEHGRNMMPAFKNFSEEEMDALLAYIYDEEEETAVSKEPGLGNSSPKVTYSINKFGKFLDSNGFPAIRPPWGTLNAINLNTGEYLWTVPFGTYPELMEKGYPVTGAESYGGPVVTAGGLLFIAGTKDKMFRVYDKNTGEQLWEAKLPAAGFATPSTYEVDGKQYVVIACGGSKLDAEGGDSYVAFALPGSSDGEQDE
ncbi:pyrroloquinoline quinone-dependent dehydrogenase [Salegentibacter mishustinae]|uniref:pyrroloquinoline quinone-dependent dehydrogenase n=1 Tax=Salegentibacter mishustinae TaxID=270918 RepID=UPI001CE05860|nr:pyrroloquinoline quinone-dependent dehydrogenase [Salegentibacter mishustinae]UBZ05586.1 pyrroloquinoline quinone-dependent dehydrogenase [Salegentibacter mishustinae]